MNHQLSRRISSIFSENKHEVFRVFSKISRRYFQERFNMAAFQFLKHILYFNIKINLFIPIVKNGQTYFENQDL